MNPPPELVAEEEAGGFMVEGHWPDECAPLVSCNPLNDTRRAGFIGVRSLRRYSRGGPESEDVPDGEEGELWSEGPSAFC